MPLQQAPLIAIGSILTAGSRGAVEVVGEEDLHYPVNDTNKTPGVFPAFRRQCNLVRLAVFAALPARGQAASKASAPALTAEESRRKEAIEHYIRARLYAQDTEFEDAVKEFRKAVDLDPGNGAYLDSLGWTYFQLGKLDLAGKNLQEASELNPDDPTIEEHLGDLCEKQGEVGKARAHWKRALTLKPEDGGRKLEEKLRRTEGVADILGKK